jgi:hypothetical protein
MRGPEHAAWQSRLSHVGQAHLAIESAWARARVVSRIVGLDAYGVV